MWGTIGKLFRFVIVLSCIVAVRILFLVLVSLSSRRPDKFAVAFGCPQLYPRIEGRNQLLLLTLCGLLWTVFFLNVARSRSHSCFLLIFDADADANFDVHT